MIKGHIKTESGKKEIDVTITTEVQRWDKAYKVRVDPVGLFSLFGLVRRLHVPDIRSVDVRSFGWVPALHKCGG